MTTSVSLPSFIWRIFLISPLRNGLFWGHWFIHSPSPSLPSIYYIAYLLQGSLREMEAIGSSRTLEPIFQATWYHILKRCNVKFQQIIEDFISDVLKASWQMLHWMTQTMHAVYVNVDALTSHTSFVTIFWHKIHSSLYLCNLFFSGGHETNKTDL
jgi:hypothetical protein